MSGFILNKGLYQRSKAGFLIRPNVAGPPGFGVERV
jgi:hypothetical protein